MKRTVARISLVVCLLVSGQAQQPKPSPPPVPIRVPVDADAEQDTIKINTNLVQIDAVVTRAGKQVNDLKAEDFEVLEDNQPRAITNFSYITNGAPAPAPAVAAKSNTPSVPPAIHPADARRTIALVVDDLGMGIQSIDNVKKQLRKFVNEQISPNDLIAILRTSAEIGALQQFTNDQRVLLSAIDHIKWYPCSRAGKNAFTGNDRTCAGLTYSQSLQALRYIATGMTSLPGRKSMVVFSDMMPVDTEDPGLNPDSPQAAAASGTLPEPVVMPKVNTGGTDTGPVNTTIDFHSSYKQELQHIAELAIRGSVVIYTVETRGLEVTFPPASESLGRTGSAGSIVRQMAQSISQRSENLFVNRQGSEMIARDTGGFNIHNSNDFGLKRVYEDQQGYYLIGFRPAEETFDGKFHHVTVHAKGKELTVRTRKGFYGVTDQEARATLRQSPTTIDDALTSPFGANQILVRMSALFVNSNEAGSFLRSSIYVNGADLAFTQDAGGSHNAKFDVTSILFGDNGGVVYERSQTATLHLNEQQYAQTLREGVSYGFDLPVKDSGASQFRVAVKDDTSGRLGTAGQVVAVPDLRQNRLALSGIILTSNNENAATGSTEAGPLIARAARQFHQGETLTFGYAVYKAQLGNDNRPQLTSQTQIFYDGKMIYSGAPTPIDVTGQQDLQRIIGGSRLVLGKDFPIGDYILQINVTDPLAKEKRRMATQWVDFEVVK